MNNNQVNNFTCFDNMKIAVALYELNKSDSGNESLSLVYKNDDFNEEMLLENGQYFRISKDKYCFMSLQEVEEVLIKEVLGLGNSERFFKFSESDNVNYNVFANLFMNKYIQLIIIENIDAEIIGEVINNSMNGFFLLDLEGNIIMANKDAIHEYGYTMNEFRKMNIIDLVSPDNSSYVKTQINEARQGISEFQIVYYRKDGTSFHVEVKFMGINYNSKQYIANIVRNVENKIKAEERINQLVSIVEESNDIIIGNDFDGNIISWNKGAELFTGYTKEEVIGKHLSILLPERANYQEEIGKRFENIKRGLEVQNFEVLRKKKNGDLVTLSLTVFPIYDIDKNVIGSSAIGRDITEKQKLIDKLKENEKKWSLTLNVTKISVWEYNIVNNQIIDNGLFYKILSYDKESKGLFFEEFLQFIHQDDAGRLKADLAYILEGNKFKNTYRFLNSSNDYQYLVITGEIVEYTNDGQPFRMIGIMQDQTMEYVMQEDLRKSEEKYRTLYSAMDQGVALHEIIFDENNKPIDYIYLDLNKSYEKIFNVDGKARLGKKASVVNPEACRFWVEKLGDIALTGKPGKAEFYSKITNNYLEIYYFTPKEGQFATLITDVTESRLRESKLSESYEELSAVYEELAATEEELREKYEEVNIMKEEAVKANNAKSLFLANMSHEIRTPMNGVLGFLQLLELTELSEAQKDYVNVIRNSSEHLLEVINDILDISKIEAGKLVLNHQKFNLRTVITNTFKELSLTAKNKGLDLKYFINDIVEDEYMGDSVRLTQILINLINNAIKFTEKGHVYLDVKELYKANEKTKLQFSVKDTGIGISEDFRGEIFKIFTQEEASYSKKYGGTGLGLSISKRLANMMNGDLWYDSKVGEGSTFYFTVELTNCSITGIKTENNNDHLDINDEFQQQKMILVVEDNEINREVTSAFLKHLNYKHVCVNDGKEALDYVEKNPVDIILMDIQMPVLDGLETTKLIRNMEEGTGAHRTIIAVTAYTLSSDREKFLNSGIDDYVSKPFDFNSLRDTIKKYV